MSIIDVDEPTEAMLDGRYRLGALLGSGAMAEVYRAEDVLLARTVAVKLMRTEGAIVSRERARGEVTALAALNHDCLVTLYDARIDSDRSGYLVMECVEGPTLAERLTSGPLDPRELTTLAEDLAGALAAVHRAGIVHRDVKPSNVLLADGARSRRPFRAKLSDFGIAHLSDSARLTSPGLVIGTAAYLAPEQARGATPAPPADVYSLGLVLREALTGERAHPQATSIEAVLARLSVPVTIPDDVPAHWAELLGRMLRQDPAERPSAAEVADRVASFADAPAAPTTSPERSAASAPTAVTVLLTPTAPPPDPAAAVTSAAAPRARPRRTGAGRRRALGIGIGATGVGLAVSAGALVWALTAGPGHAPAAPVVEPTAPAVVEEAPAEPVVDDGDAPPAGDPRGRDDAGRAERDAAKEAEKARADAEKAAKDAQKDTGTRPR